MKTKTTVTTRRATQNEREPLAKWRKVMMMCAGRGTVQKQEVWTADCQMEVE